MRGLFLTWYTLSLLPCYTQLTELLLPSILNRELSNTTFLSLTLFLISVCMKILSNYGLWFDFIVVKLGSLVFLFDAFLEINHFTKLACYIN